MGRIDTRVDDGHWDGLERRKREPRAVEAAVAEIPLLRNERIARREGEVARDERLDVSDSADSAQRRPGREVREQHRNRPQALRLRTRPPLDCSGNTTSIGSLGDPDCDTSRVGPSREGKPSAHDQQYEGDASHPETWSTGDVPAAKLVVAETRAR